MSAISRYPRLCGIQLLLLIATCILSCLAPIEVKGQTSPAGELLYVAPDLYSQPTSENPQANSEQAEQLYQQARSACERGDVGESLRLATRSVCADPSHAGARRVLGYRQVGDSWVGSYAARRLKRGELWNSQFGWILAEDAHRWEAGERPLGKHWISAQDDARRHATIDNGWRIRTDHFSIVTNHSRASAVKLATQLETLFQLWRQVFGGFVLEPSELLKRFDGKLSSGYRRKPFQVFYYRTRAEYNRALIRLQPRIEMTLGIYFDTTRKAHFFAGEDQHAATINHEAVHQFFQESRPAARQVGALANAWLIEGVACYFESLTPQEHAQASQCFSLGAPDAGRLPAAKHRRLVDKFYVPLAELSTMGTTDLQRRTDIARLYSQSAGLTTFLAQGRNGTLKPALVKLLKLIYAGRDKPTSLAELTSQSFEQLDEQYAEFLRELP